MDISYWIIIVCSKYIYEILPNPAISIMHVLSSEPGAYSEAWFIADRMNPNKWSYIALIIESLVLRAAKLLKGILEMIKNHLKLDFHL